MADVHMVKLEIDVPKELADIANLAVLVATDIKAGKKGMEIAADCFGALRDALDGSQLIPSEIKKREAIGLLAITALKMFDIFVPVKVAAAEAVADVPAAEERDVTPAAAPAAIAPAAQS